MTLLTYNCVDDITVDISVSWLPEGSVYRGLALPRITQVHDNDAATTTTMTTATATTFSFHFFVYHAYFPWSALERPGPQKR